MQDILRKSGEGKTVTVLRMFYVLNFPCRIMRLYTDSMAMDLAENSYIGFSPKRTFQNVQLMGQFALRVIPSYLKFQKDRNKI